MVSLSAELKAISGKISTHNMVVSGEFITSRQKYNSHVKSVTNTRTRCFIFKHLVKLRTQSNTHTARCTTPVLGSRSLSNLFLFR